MKFSIIIPVYNRPAELEELLDSLTHQTVKDFEVVIVDDGSAERSESVAANFSAVLDTHYYYKENEGPGPTRNYAATRSHGDYLVFLDSDCVLPSTYLQRINEELQRDACDAFGGPDRAHPDFSDLQKAISHSMTSFFTTGGIRGGARKLDKFYPRSFNMGIRCEVFDDLGGFSDMRFGEDVELSIRIFEKGYHCRLFPEAWVWHKRRTDLCKFFKQVHNSGIARINLYKRHPKSLKLVHLLPACFTIGLVLLIVAGAVWHWLWTLILLYALAIFADASIQNKSTKIGCLAVAAAFVQLTGYGTGFIRAWWKRCVCGKPEFEAFKNNFYK